MQIRNPIIGMRKEKAARPPSPTPSPGNYRQSSDQPIVVRQLVTAGPVGSGGQKYERPIAAGLQSPIARDFREC